MKKSSLFPFIVITLVCITLSGCGTSDRGSSNASNTSNTTTNTETMQKGSQSREINTNRPGGPRVRNDNE